MPEKRVNCIDRTREAEKEEQFVPERLEKSRTTFRNLEKSKNNSKPRVGN